MVEPHAQYPRWLIFKSRYQIVRRQNIWGGIVTALRPRFPSAIGRAQSGLELAPNLGPGLVGKFRGQVKGRSGGENESSSNSTAQRFLSIQTTVYNAFYVQRHLLQRRNFKDFRAKTFAVWRQRRLAA